MGLAEDLHGTFIFNSMVQSLVGPLAGRHQSSINSPTSLHLRFEFLVSSVHEFRPPALGRPCCLLFRLHSLQEGCVFEISMCGKLSHGTVDPSSTREPERPARTDVGDESFPQPFRGSPLRSLVQHGALLHSTHVHARRRQIRRVSVSMPGESWVCATSCKFWATH